jgi:hypothetical protein
MQEVATGYRISGRLLGSFFLASGIDFGWERRLDLYHVRGRKCLDTGGIQCSGQHPLLKKFA